jgi:hypothetical protein
MTPSAQLADQFAYTVNALLDEIQLKNFGTNYKEAIDNFSSNFFKV